MVGQPFDVVKVRYQTTQFAGRYASTYQALGKQLELGGDGADGSIGTIMREEKVHLNS